MSDRLSLISNENVFGAIAKSNGRDSASGCRDAPLSDRA